MNSVKIMIRTSSGLMWQRLQTLKTDSLDRALRLRFYKSRLSARGSQRRRWPRRVLLTSAGLATVTMGMGIKQMVGLL